MTKKIAVTGSSGFIGTHLCKALAETTDSKISGLDIAAPSNRVIDAYLQADICTLDEPQKQVFATAETVFHLAAKAEAVIPFNELADLTLTNVNGTIDVLQATQSGRLIFASSSAVYGTSGVEKIGSDWKGVNPIGAYGMTKAMGELICNDWAQRTGSVAVLFRFGNVIGQGCRGLISYLVNHAKRYPDGSVPAQARGQGQIIRDYVPVDYTVKVLIAAMEADFAPGTSIAFNLGTGRPQTNSEVAAIVQRVLKQHGYQLTINWNNPIPASEAKAVVLDPEATVRAFDLPIPSHDEVVATIEAATLSHLSRSK